MQSREPIDLILIFSRDFGIRGCGFVFFRELSLYKSADQFQIYKVGEVTIDEDSVSGGCKLCMAMDVSS